MKKKNLSLFTLMTLLFPLLKLNSIFNHIIVFIKILYSRLMLQTKKIDVLVKAFKYYFCFFHLI